MNLYELTKSISQVISELYNFVYNLLFYRITLFDLSFTVIESLGILATVGIGVYVTVKIVSIFI